MSRTCTLLIPHLLPPRVAGDNNSDELSRGLHLPALRTLRTLLARAQHTTPSGANTTAWLCAAFGVAQQQDWPVAPLTLMTDGVDPGNQYWLRVDPVYLEPRRDALVLTDPAALALADAETDNISATLTQHLAQDGHQFIAPHPMRWYLGLSAAPKVQTTALADVIGRDTRHFLAQGEDALHWQRLITELQMLLHAHPVNAEREARGLFPVNSVWLWGGGHLPPAGNTCYTALWSNDSLARALAHHAACFEQDEPASATHVLSGTAAADTHDLIVLHTPADALRSGNLAAWRDALQRLESDWFAPLLAALKSRAVSQIAIVHCDAQRSQQFTMRPADIYKFWRKNKYL